MSHVPRAPTVAPTTRSACSQVPMDVDPRTPTTSNIRPQLPRRAPQHPASAPSLGACCSVSRGRAEVQELLLNFQEGLNRVLESNLETPMVTTPAAGNASLDGFAENSASAPPPSLCSVCTKNIASPLNAQWYSCASCHIVVVSDLFVNRLTNEVNVVQCNGCYDKAKPGFCLSTMGPHNMKLETSARASDLPIPRLPVPWVPSNSTSEPEALNPSFMSTTSTPEVRHPPVSTPRWAAQEHVVHNGIICDMCSETVKGIRHKCLDCPGDSLSIFNGFNWFADMATADYDLCTTCISEGAAQAHNPFHEFFDINEPGRVVVHTVFSGNGEREAAREPSRRTSAPAAAAVHDATCDLCDSRILGDRYVYPPLYRPQ